MNRLCFACDLKDDPEAIAKYMELHQTENIWPEIVESIKAAYVLDMQIYLIGNRLFMIMEVADNYNAERKTEMDAANPKVQEWEQLMSSFQQPVLWATQGQKWTPMDRIFKLENSTTE